MTARKLHNLYADSIVMHLNRCDPAQSFGAHYSLLIRKGSKLEWLILHLTNWPVMSARIGQDYESFVTVYIRGKLPKR